MILSVQAGFQTEKSFMALRTWDRLTGRRLISALFRHLLMTTFVKKPKMSEPRDFTPMEQAVTDLVNKSFEKDGPLEAGQLLQLEQFIENITTVRELLTAAQSRDRVRSARLEMINEAFDLVERTIKELGEKRLTQSLKKLRFECVEDFIKVAEESTTGTPEKRPEIDEQSRSKRTLGAV